MKPIKITGTTFKHFEYTKEDLIQLMRLRKYKPDDIFLSVDIPGGGDYSNCTLEIGDEIQVLKVIIREEIK